MLLAGNQISRLTLQQPRGEQGKPNICSPLHVYYSMSKYQVQTRQRVRQVVLLFFPFSKEWSKVGGFCLGFHFIKGGDEPEKGAVRESVTMLKCTKRSCHVTADNIQMISPLFSFLSRKFLPNIIVCT